LGLRPKPRKGTSPLDPVQIYIFIFSRREKIKRIEILKGSKGLRPLAGLGGAQGLVLELFIGHFAAALSYQADDFAL
jgi:hypothetical protein